ncbi:MAG: aminotransferase class III-fold pyridoxal phosphate-dependent enzyme [Planctomycetota bacterium]|nr:MAG: aminotransferase class III-fold pyridoxal phosphate-dependent enzyme [Planctomycetota bacterium]
MAQGAVWAARTAMNTAIIIQARMSSRRFPGKMLASLGDGTLLSQVLGRAQQVRAVQRVVLATSDHADDDALAAAAAAQGVAVHRGPLDDVLARFIGAMGDADTVVRLTGDCPLLEPELVDAMLQRFAAGDVDYLSNISPPSWPDGLDVEILRAEALRMAHVESDSAHDREHVTPFIRSRPERFRLANYPCPHGDISNYHWSVDHPQDLALVEDLLAACGKEARLGDILALLQRQSELRERCYKAMPNEGAVATFQRELRATRPLPTITRSNELWRQAQELIPAGTQTLSKGPNQFCNGVGPKYLVRGEGAMVWDADGNAYIDYPMALGPVTLGHAHPRVSEAVCQQLAQGNAFSLMHPLEVALARRLVDIIPCAEQVRFGKNGSDATSACIRAARALTGRDHIARCGYHGWQDWSIDRSYGIRSRGVPEAIFNLTHPFPFNDLPALEALLTAQPCAAVILECASVEAPAPGYLEGVKELAHRHGALFVFDEVITGFRWARGGAQEHFGVTPDLCAMGKGLANGLPLAVVAGTRAAMRAFDEIFFSFTFGGETTALAAAMVTLDVMEEHDYWAHAWRQGERLQMGFNAAAASHGCQDFARCAGMPPWTIVVFSDTPRWRGLQLKTLFQQEMLSQGILFSGSQFISLAHDDAIIERTIAAYQEAFRVLRFAIDAHAVDALCQGAENELIFRRA